MSRRATKTENLARGIPGKVVFKPKHFVQHESGRSGPVERIFPNAGVPRPDSVIRQGVCFRCGALESQMCRGKIAGPDQPYCREIG